MPGLPGWGGPDRGVQYARIVPEYKEPTYAYLEMGYGDEAWDGKVLCSSVQPKCVIINDTRRKRFISSVLNT